MKIFKTICACFIVTSCISYSYVKDVDNGNFKGINAGQTYTFRTTGHKIERFTVAAIEKDTIKGVHKNEVFALAKSDITKIYRSNTGGTFALTGGVVGVAAVIYYVTSQFDKGMHE